MVDKLEKRRPWLMSAIRQAHHNLPLSLRVKAAKRKREGSPKSHGSGGEVSQGFLSAVNGWIIKTKLFLL